jgi:hypothetical protein
MKSGLWFVFFVVFGITGFAQLTLLLGSCGSNPGFSVAYRCPMFVGIYLGFATPILLIIAAAYSIHRFAYLREKAARD